eukprot:1295522-Pyramimonas_sp.AAC.1
MESITLRLLSAESCAISERMAVMRTIAPALFMVSSFGQEIPMRNIRTATHWDFTPTASSGLFKIRQSFSLRKLMSLGHACWARGPVASRGCVDDASLSAVARVIFCMSVQGPAVVRLVSEVASASVRPWVWRIVVVKADT